MSLRRFLVSGFMVGFLGIGAVGASAHSINDYPSNGWQYTILDRVFYTAPNNWQSSSTTLGRTPRWQRGPD